jgi:hypothetical protein
LRKKRKAIVWDIKRKLPDDVFRTQVPGSKPLARLAWAEHPKDLHIPGGPVESGVAGRSVAAVAGKLAHAWMLANRAEAGVPAQPVDRRLDRHEPPPCPALDSWLH